MPRGRKPLPPAEQIGEKLGPMTPEARAELADASTLDMAAIEQSGVLVSAGRMQTYQFLQKLSHVGLAKEFEKVRESKEYKGLPYRDSDGKVRRVVDLHEFCEVFLGRSYQRIAEDCQNLNLLGDELYEHALGLGLTTRNFREIRSLPQDDQQLVKEAIAAKSREAVIEILEDVVKRHDKEKKKLLKQIGDVSDNLEAQRKVTARKDEKLNEYARERERRKKLPELELTEVQLGEMAFEATQVIGSMSLFRDKLSEVMQRDEVPQVLLDHACNMLTFMAQEILAIQSQFAMPIKLEQEMDPHYITKLVQAQTTRGDKS